LVNSIDQYTVLANEELPAANIAERISIAEKGLHLNEKSPFVAGVLSVIPGLGYAYTNHYQTAISSFILNGVLGFATYSSFNNDNIGLGILTGIFSAAFYIANVDGSVKSAHRYNRRQKEFIIQQLENKTNL
jgi:hypothetical protein